MPNAPKRSQNPPLPVRAAASAASRARALRIAGVSTVPRTAASMVATSMARLGGSFFGAAGSGGVGFCKNGLPYLHHAVSESRAVAAEAAGSGALEQRAQRAILRRKVASKSNQAKSVRIVCQKLGTLPSRFASLAQPGRLGRFAKHAILLHIQIGPDHRDALPARLRLGFFSFGALVHLLWCSRRPEILARTTSVPQTTFSGKKDCVILRELADAPQAVEA